MDVRVIGMRPVKKDFGVLLAHADVEVSCCGDKLEIRGLCVFQGNGDGLWVGLPGRKGEKRFFPFAVFSRELRRRVEAGVLAAFNAAARNGP
jgi:DNA-binding cell septation regulator SpoVG